MGNMQGTQEHDDMARATASVLGERDEKKRPGLELGWKREGRDTAAAFPQPRKHLCSLGPPMYPGPLRFHLVLPLALVAPSFAPLDFFSPSRFSGRIMLWASPQTAPPHEGATSAFPALPLLQAHLFPLWDRIFDSPPSSPPSPWGGKKKKSTNSPGRGSRHWGLEGGEQGGPSRRKAHRPWEDRAGATGRVRAALLLPSATPAHCPGGFNTTNGTGVCGVRSEREERGAGETNR